MLLVVKKGQEASVLGVFEKWDLPCSEIGEVTNDGILRFYMNGELEAALPADELHWAAAHPSMSGHTAGRIIWIRYMPLTKFHSRSCRYEIYCVETGRSSHYCKRWVFEQYDSMVGTGTTNTNSPVMLPLYWLNSAGKAAGINNRL
ncbi:MAG: hypothetical protein U0T56_11640 [Ferruginibacter sp.]